MTRLAAIAVALLGTALYANTLEAPFILDDAPNITENPHLRLQRLDLEGLLAASRGPTRGRPVAYASFALNHLVGGYDVTGYHVVNIAIHIACGILVYLLAAATLALRTHTTHAPALSAHRGELAALLAALFFVAHPVQTQAVTYVVQRMTSLATLFYLLALLLYLRGRMTEAAPRRPLFFAGALAAWLVALGSKQVAATLPVAVLLYEFAFFADLDRSWWRRHRWTLVGALGVTLAVAAFYLKGDPASILKAYAVRDFSLLERLLTQPRVVVFYLSLVVLPLPSRLNLLHRFTTSHSPIDPPATLLAILALLGLLALAPLLASRERLAAFCILWFFLQLALESSVLGLEMAFEHRLYLPMFGAALLAADVIVRAVPGPPARAVVIGALIVALLGVGTIVRNAAWRDRVTFWSDAVSKSPESPRAHNSLGRALADEGRLEEADREFREALRIKPRHTESHFNLGLVAYQRGRDAEAIEHYTAALEIDPSYARAHNNLAAALVRQGRHEEAIHHFRETVRLDPYHTRAHFNLALLLEGRERFEEARSHYAAVLRLRPGDAEARARLQRVEALSASRRRAASP